MSSTILLIEDDLALRENTAELLELQGYDILTAPDGKAGIAKAIQHLPDLIVCDIMMPEADGYEVLNTLANNDSTKWIPFIFLSAKTEHKEIRKGMDLGADDYLTKPFEEEELVSAIESRLAKSTLMAAQVSSTPQPQNGDAIRGLNELKNHFDDHGEISNYEAGEDVYREGARAHHVYLILKGVAKSHRMDENGKELITQLHQADDLLGFGSLTDASARKETATAMEPVELAALPVSGLKTLVKDNHNLAVELINLLSDDLLEIKDHLLQMAYGSVRKKTAQTIIQFAEVMGTKNHDQIKISRYDLASVAGIATESLIRTLSGFKKKGLIAIEGRNIRILDLNALEQVE